MFHETHFSVMNKRNFHLINILFNICSILSICLAYYQGWFGPVTEEFKSILILYVGEIFNPVNLCFAIFFFGIIIASTIKKWKNNELVPDISIGLKQFKCIFIPIIAVLIVIQFLLCKYVEGSGWLIAFLMIFSNMNIFLFCYVMRLHEYVDDLLEKKSK